VVGRVAVEAAGVATTAAVEKAQAQWVGDTRTHARTHAPVVGVGDHAVAVEDAADGLLGPVTTGQLSRHEVAGSPGGGGGGGWMWWWFRWRGHGHGEQ